MASIQQPYSPYTGGEERYFRLDSGYLYFLELVDTQVITSATQTLYFNTPQWIHSFLSNMKVQDTSPPANNVAWFKDILILDHALNSNDGGCIK